MQKGFQFIEEMAHADVAFHAWGATPSELFMAAGEALMSILANPATVGFQWTHDVNLDKSTIEELLFEWLSLFVFFKDAEAVVFHKVEANVWHDHETHAWHVRSTLIGDRIDATAQELRSDVKAITKHLYEVHTESGKYQARVVVDV